MQIELFYEIDRTPNMGYIHKISGFRHSRDPYTKNQPIPENVYTINDMDFLDLVKALDHTAIIAIDRVNKNKMDYDFHSGNLYLKLLTAPSNNIYKGTFLDSLS